MLKTAEEIRGTISGTTSTRSRPTDPDAPNILLLKDIDVKYMYKENEEKSLDED